MKKIFSLLLALCLLTLCGAALADGDLLSDIQSRGYLTIATEGNWSPWTYHDENDVLTGLDIEIGTLIAHGLGVEPEFQETDWDAIHGGCLGFPAGGRGYRPVRHRVQRRGLHRRAG